MSAFSAGDLTVRGGGEAACLRRDELRRRAEAVLAPYLADRGFHFQGVPG